MNFARNRMAMLIAMFLMLAMAISLVALPPAKAHTPPVEFPSWPYLVPSPNPVGVGQRVIIVMWIDKPLPESNVGNDIRRHGYTLTITKPDGTTEKKEWAVVDDTTSIQYYVYTPAQVGEYTLKFDYAGQTYTWDATNNQRTYTNDIFLPASKTVTLTVQQDPLPEPINSYPLPTEYWTRPIEGQNTDWWSISSNWLSGAYTIRGIQNDGAAPETPHIMWTKSIQDGGVVGGSITTALDGDTYYSGMAYMTRANNPIILHGRLYYELPFGNSGGGGGWMCVDLRTGEEIWYNANLGDSGVPEPSFGYLYDLHSENQHGTLGNGLLVYQSGFGTNTWRFIEPRTGNVIDGFNVTGIPPTGAGFGQTSGPAEVIGPNGYLIRYNLNLARGWLAQWNSSRTVWNTAGFGPAQGGAIDGSTASRYDWNVTLSRPLPAGMSIRESFLDDLMLVSNLAPAYGGGFTIFGTIDPYTVAAISLKPGSRGQVMWVKNYTAPNKLTREWAPYGGGGDPVNRIFVMKDVETMTFTGYSMDDGNKVWGPTPSQPDYDYFNLQSFIVYDRLYSAGYGGYVFCYSVIDGSLLWTYGNGGEGNSTNAGLVTAWGNYPQFIMAFADGKLYTSTYEHSPNSPHYKGMTIRCIDAYTGEELWQVLADGSAFEYGSKAFAVASGFAVWLNAYDMQLYCAGRGPSATTVSVKNDVLSLGSSVMITGTVMDIAAGTNQPEQAARFPAGVPAISDASMGAWMEYVYMQKPRPMDAVGVPVTIDVLDSNGNYRNIGTATTDSSGFFKFMWTPDITGEYTVIATFAGSKGYWPSFAETAFGVDEAPEAPATPEPITLPPTEMYILYATIAIIATIVIIGLLILRKK